MRVPYIKGSATSAAAADAIEGVRRGQETRVYQYLLRRGTHGATDEEIARDCGLNPSSARPRRIRLLEGGMICASAQTRKTSAGRNAVVFLIAPKHWRTQQMEML